MGGFPSRHTTNIPTWAYMQVVRLRSGLANIATWHMYCDFTYSLPTFTFSQPYGGQNRTLKLESASCRPHMRHAAHLHLSPGAQLDQKPGNHPRRVSLWSRCCKGQSYLGTAGSRLGKLRSCHAAYAMQASIDALVLACASRLTHLRWLARLRVSHLSRFTGGPSARLGGAC